MIVSFVQPVLNLRYIGFTMVFLLISGLLVVIFIRAPGGSKQILILASGRKSAFLRREPWTVGPEVFL